MCACQDRHLGNSAISKHSTKLLKWRRVCKVRFFWSTSITDHSLTSFQHHGQLLTRWRSMPNLVGLTGGVCKTDREEKKRASIFPSIWACLFILMSMYVKWDREMYTGIHGPTHPVLNGEAIPCHQSWGEGSGGKEEDRNGERDKQRERDMGVEAVAGLLPVSWLIWTIFCLMSHFIPPT